MGSGASTETKSEQCPPSDKAKLYQIFKRHDTNGDGVMDLPELASVLEAAGIDKTDVKHLRQIAMNSADANKDGKVSYVEFIDWVLGGEPLCNEGNISVALLLSDLVINLVGCSNVPHMDMFTSNSIYVVVSVHVGSETVCSIQSALGTGSNEVVWGEALKLPVCPSDLSLTKSELKFEVWDKDTLRDDFVGEATMSLSDFIKRPTRRLLLACRGDAVLSSSVPREPCYLTVSIDVDSMPKAWPRPVLDDLDISKYPKHIFIMSRGTRGDIQPFVALARGMAEEFGWLITICSEIRWKEFIYSKTKGLRKGRVRFLPSGGDTQTRIERAGAKWMMESKTEVLQAMMLAWSEAEFFSSGPCFVYNCKRLQALGRVDLIISAFNLVGLGLLVSEVCSVPLATFVLQPSSIPSSDPTWKSVVNIDTGNKFSLTDFLEDSFTSHKTLALLKTLAESNPFASFTLSHLRKEHGLKPAETWKVMFDNEVPIIIPMAPETFARPSDWGSHIRFTDYIFLHTGVGGLEGTLDPEIADFIRQARAANRKLVVMSFSSMPVARKKMLQSVVKMLDESDFQFSLVYVGKKYDDSIPAALESQAEILTKDGRFLEVERADFGVLFQEMDAFIIHGGLGTTVEALRMHKPVAVTGLLLMDQRFWGHVCFEKGVGPEPVHIDEFTNICVDFINRAFCEDSEYTNRAQSLTWGDEAGDGVKVNIHAFAEILEEGVNVVQTKC